MKKLLFLILIVVCACSTPKYTYYFDYVKNPQPKEPVQMPAIASIDPALTTASNGPTSAPATSLVEHSGSDKPSHHRTSVVKNDSAHKKFTKYDKKELRTVLRSSVKRDRPAKTGREWAAITGFASALASLIVLLVPAIASVFFFFFVAAMIFSVIGLKSSRRGLSIAGIIIGASVLISVVVLFVLSFSGNA